MIKEALEYIVNIGGSKLSYIDKDYRKNGSDVYSDKPLHYISPYKYAKAISLVTLNSLVDYVKSGIDIDLYGKTSGEAMLCLVSSPTHVELFSPLDADRKREILADVDANVPNFSFNRFIQNEEFLINVQSKFLDAGDRDLILKFAGTVESGTVANYSDDGISQKATVSEGIASKADARVPNPVTLQPYRTFVEVEQPCSQFVFRMENDRMDGVSCALFEADGGAWKNEAMDNIKSYLAKNLDGYNVEILS